jgi:RNA polymerase sigma-70 factor (ECF subfamily)
MKAMSESHLINEDWTLSKSQGNHEVLHVLSSRYYSVLYFVAYRLLRNHREAEDAVQNGLLAASYSASSFEDEGAFRSWLIRVLIDQALTIFRKKTVIDRCKTDDWKRVWVMSGI